MDRIQLIFVPNLDDYSDYTFNAIRSNEVASSVCYISLNKSRDTLLKMLSADGFDIKRFFVVDCITLMVKDAEPCERCEFINAPYDLHMISEAVKRAVSQGYKFVICDSLSNLISYGTLKSYGRVMPAGSNLLTSFIKSVLPEIEKSNGSLVFMCKQVDKGLPVIQESLPIFEKVLELK